MLVLTCIYAYVHTCGMLAHPTDPPVHPHSVQACSLAHTHTHRMAASTHTHTHVHTGRQQARCLLACTHTHKTAASTHTHVHTGRQHA